MVWLIFFKVIHKGRLFWLNKLEIAPPHVARVDYYLVTIIIISPQLSYYYNIVSTIGKFYAHFLTNMNQPIQVADNQLLR